MCKKVVILSFVILACFVLSLQVSALDVSARSAVLIAQLDGRVLYSKNASARLPIASTTKLMTALIAAQRCDKTESMTVVREAVGVEGSSIYLKEGETVTVETLLYGLLLSSGNDAANMLAIHISGSVAQFTELMNRKAGEMGLLDTHFDTPSGLDGKTHYSSAADLAKIASAAMNIPEIAEIMSTKSKTIGGRTFTNHNKLLSIYRYADGGKTGFTKKAGRCLVSTAEKDGLRLIAVTLDAPDDWNDHIRLYNYGFSAIRYETLCEISDVYSVYVTGSEKTCLLVRPAETAGRLAETSSAEIKRTVILPRFLYAPVKNGQKVGTLIFSSGDTEVARVDLIASETAAYRTEKRGGFGRVFDFMEDLWQSLFGFKNTSRSVASARAEALSG